MNNTPYRPPVIDTEGAYDDSDLLQDFINRARDFNRPWTWTDPIREGAANLIQDFRPSTMEIERLQGLVGLDDEAFRAQNQERLLRLLPQNVRDDYLKGQIEALTEGRDRVGVIAGAVAPTPHREPDTWYGKLGYGALEMLPHIAAAVPMIKALGPMGYAGATTFTGNQSAQENVYDALRSQGLSLDEAREQATAFLPNAADALIRGGTNFGTMGLLNKIPMVAGASSPYSQVLKNIAMASGVSGAGAMGEQALTNYRTNTENDIAELAKTGLTAAGVTGAVGLGNALFNWRNLRELQRQYWENMKPVAIDWPPSDNNSSGNASANRPNNPNPNGGGEFPQIEVMTPEKAARLQKQGEVLAKYKLSPETDLWKGIQEGSIPDDTAVNILVDMGAKPDIARSLVTGSKTLADIERGANNLLRGVPKSAQEIPRQPQTFEFNANEWQDPLYSKSRPVKTMDKHATPENVTPPQTTQINTPNSPADTAISIPPAIPPNTAQQKKNTPVWRYQGSLGSSFPAVKDLQLDDEDRLLGNQEGTFRNGTLTVQDAEGNSSNVYVRFNGSEANPAVTFSLIPYGSNNPNEGDLDIAWYDIRRNKFSALARGEHDSLVEPIIEQFRQHLGDFFTPNNPIPTQQDTTPTPAQFLKDIRAKKKQLGYDIRRQEKELGITPQKNIDIDALERKYQRENDKVNDVKSITDVFNLGRDIYTNMGQNKYSQLQSDNNQDIDYLFSVPEQTPSTQTPQAPQVIALGSEEAFYDDEQADNSFSVNNAQEQDIPEPRTQDNRQIRKTPNVIGSLGANEAYYDYDYYSDTGGDNSSPEQDIPDAHVPDLQPALTDFPQTNSSERRKFYKLPDSERIDNSLFDSLHSGSVEIIDADGNKRSVNVKFDPLTSTFFFAFADGHIRRSGYNEGSLGTYFYKDNKLVSPYGKHQELKAAYRAFRQNFSSFHSHNQANTQILPQVTALTESQQTPTRKPSDELANIAQTKPPKQTKLQPVGKPFIYVEDDLGRVKQVTNPEAVKIRDSNLQLLDDAENDDERIKLLDTLTHQQLKDMTDSGAFGVNYYQGQTKKDYITSIIAARNKRLDDSRREQQKLQKRGEAAKTEPVTATATETAKPKPAPAIVDTEYPFNLEDSYQGMPKQELKAAAEKNNSLISSIKDEDTLRKRLSGLHTPMLRAMSGIYGTGYKKDDFINSIIRVATRPIPDNATLKAGAFSVPGINGTWTVKPNGADNSFTISNDDILHSSMVYDPKGNYFMSLSQLDSDTTGAVQDYFKEHITDFYEEGGNQTQTVQPTPTPAENTATAKSDKPEKVRLQPLGNVNPDEIAEQNLDILRRTINEKERKKLLNAQSMTTDDLKRMRAYIKRKYNTDMGVQGKRNDIINSILKFINRDLHQNNAGNTTQEDTTQPQVQEQERKPVQEDKPTKLTPVGNPYREDYSTGKVTRNPNATDTALRNLDILRNAADNDERRKLLNSLDKMQLFDMDFALENAKPSIHLPGTGDRKKDYIERFIQLIENEKNTDAKQPEKSETPHPSGNVSPVRVISFDQQPAKAPSQPETQAQEAPERETTKNSKRIIPLDAHLEQSHFEGEKYIYVPPMTFTVKDLAFTVRNGRKHHVETIGDVVFEVSYKNYGTERFDIRPADSANIHSGPLAMLYYSYDINEDRFEKNASTKNDPVLDQSIEIAFREFLGNKYNIPFEYKKDKINYTVKNPTPENKSSDEHTLPDSPVVRLAQRIRDYIWKQFNGYGDFSPFSNNDLRKWAEEEFGGTIGEGKYDQKLAYDAMEMGINLVIQKMRIFPAKINTHSITVNILDLLDILKIIPTQTNRTPEQVEAQQFSTPPTLAYLVNWLANIGKGNTVLEPSAGTGNLAVFAKNAGANLILNDYSESGLRADILDALGWGKVYREDAMQLGNILAGEVRDGERSENDLPDRVIMNPPFSSAWNLGGKNKNQNGFKHVISALEALKHGGRLVTILGAGRDGSASSVKTWLNHIGKVYNVRALITVGGKAYQKYGTTFSNAIVVIDKTGATPKNGTVEFAFSGDFSNNEEVRKLFDALSSIRNDIQGGEDSLPGNDSTPPIPEPPKSNPAPEPLKSSGKRIIPEGAVLKEGYFTARGRFRNEVRYKVKPVKRQWLSSKQKVDALEITSPLEPYFYYYLDHDFFVVDSLIPEYQDLVHDVEKAFREHLHEFYDLPKDEAETMPENSTTAQQEEPDLADLLRHNDALKSIYTFLHDREDDIPYTEKNKYTRINNLLFNIDNAIKASMERDFRNNLQKQRQICRAIYNTLLDVGIDSNKAKKWTLDGIFPYVLRKRGYDDEHPEIPEAENANSAGIPNALKEAEQILAKLDHNSDDESEQNNIGIGSSNKSNSGKSANKKPYIVDTTSATQEYSTQQEQKQPEKSSSDKSQSGHIAKLDIQPENEDSPEPQPVSIYSDYEPQQHKGIHLFDIAKPHTSKLVETTNMKNVKLPPLKYEPDLPEDIIKSGDLTVSQLEAIAYAGQAFNKKLPNGETQGFILGDGTGSGKGRTIAGVIKDQLNHGHGNGKAIWFSIKPDLVGDAKRDWQGIGNDPKDFLELKVFGVNDSIPHDKKGILFASYSTFITKRNVAKTSDNTDNSNQTKNEETIDESRLQQVIDWLGKDFDGVIAFDECHQINNTGEAKGNRGKIEASKSAIAASKLAQALPHARVLYVSATPSDDPSKLLMFDRAGLWGKDTPFPNGLAFASAMKDGGLNAMEMFARDAKSMGFFVSRSLNSEGVTYKHITYNLNPAERKIFDQFSQAWRLIDKARHDQAIAVNVDVEAMRSESESDFRGAQLRSYKFLIVAFRVHEVIRQAKDYLEKGYSVGILTDSTFDALVDRQITKMDGSQDLRDIIISPVEELIDFVERYITVQAMNEVTTTKSDGGYIIQYEPAFDSNGKPIISQEALKIKNTLLANLRQIYFNISPIDKIINELGGQDKVAEVTGRKHRLIKQQDGSIKDLGAPPNANSEREAFNNWTEPKQVVRNKGLKNQYSITEGGTKRVIIFSSGKGGTGFSLHSDRSYKNQQRRVLIPLDLGFSSTKALQSLGRMHRSNQSSPPEFCLVSTDIPGEIRLISSISRKLAQMGAINSGERKSTTQGVFSEKDNLDSQLAKNAMSAVLKRLSLPFAFYEEIDNPRELLIQMGLLNENSAPDEEPKNLALDTIFNRILLLDLDMQEKLMSIFRQEHEALLAQAIQYAKADVGTENIRAQSVNILQDTTLLEDIDRGITTKLLEIEYTVRTRIRPFENVTDKNHCSEFFTDQYGKIYAAKKSGEYDKEGNLIRPSMDNKNGRPVQRYTLFTPDFTVTLATDADALQNKTQTLSRHFSPVSADKAKSIWERTISGENKYKTKHVFLISGVMLPIWNFLKDCASTTVLRINAPDGTSILGREIPQEQVAAVVRKFKIHFEEHKYSAQEVIDKLHKRGSFARLNNNWKIKFSTVSGEQRLEVLNMGAYGYSHAISYGLLTEIIGSQYRFFIPIGKNDILDRILKDYSVIAFDDEMSADDVRNEAITAINSSIPDSAKDYIIHPSFWHFINDPDDNPLIHKSKTPMIDPEAEARYQKSKVADSSKSAWQHIKDFGSQLWRGRHDIPELANDKGNIDDSMLKAQEWLRGLKRERQANVHEAEKELRVILLGLSTDDFDLFQRAMELTDLKETLSKDPKARMPWGLNMTEFSLVHPVRTNYIKIMGQVEKNTRVQEAMSKADKLMEDIRSKLLEAADRLGMFEVRDRLKRKHYFRHLVLEYYNMQRSGKPHPTFKNPTARSYMKHREGSDKDISSNWILAMGEVFTRMFDDIKILDTLFKLRQEYDIIEDIRKTALDYNMENALAKIMRGLQDVPEDLRKAAAEKKLSVALNTTQARAMTRLFNLAKKGDLPVGEKHQWEELVSRMAETGQIEKLSQNEQQTLARYIGWLSDMPASSPARKAAKTFLTGIKSRIRALKSIVGDDYLDWQDLIPEDYTIWSPSDSRLVFSASTLPEYMLKIAMENIDALLGADASDIGKMIASGGNKQLWVIPTRLADALDNIGKSQPMGAFGQFMTKMMGAFKQWVTISPVNGRIFKYNWRNFFGDIETVLQGNPDALYYFKQAAEDLTKIMFKGGIATGTLAEFQKRGGGLTTEAMTELERPDRIKQFANLYEQKKSMNPLKWGLKAFRAYIDLATTVTNFRESILRYAAFLSYIQLIKDNNGVPPFYGMSNPREVKAVGDDIYDIAFKLANENLGAYDQISSNLQWLRDNNFMSFLSWVEVNTKRYAQLMSNIWQGNSYLEWWIKRNGQKFIDGLIGGGNGNGGNNEPPKGNNGGDFADDDDDDGDNNFRKLFRKLAKKSPVGALRLAITLALAAPLWVMLSIWNMLNSENDEKLPPDVRNKPHLTIGSNAFTGEVMYMGDIGSAFDALQMFGVGNLITGDLRDLLDGRTTFGEIAANIIDGPVSKLVSNANPFAKAVLEGLFGKRTFPSVMHPTPIRDKGRFFAQSFGLEWYYDFLTDKPHKNFYDFSSSVVNTSNQDSSAYFYMIARRKQFEENVLGKSVDAFTMTKRGEALRNAKRAADLGDRKSLRKFLREYFRAGGSEQGLKISARTMEPLYGLNDEDEARFIRWLPKEERKILRRAMRYAERMKAKLGVWD